MNYSEEQRCSPAWTCAVYHQSGFLGYNISPKGVHMDQRKVKAIQFWPVPSTKMDLQQFLGFTIGCHWFTRNYSLITVTLTSFLQSKLKSLSWNMQVITLQLLKKAFTSAFSLMPPDHNPPFIIVVDAFTSGAYYLSGRVYHQNSIDVPCYPWWSRIMTLATRPIIWILTRPSFSPVLTSVLSFRVQECQGPLLSSLS